MIAIVTVVYYYNMCFLFQQLLCSCPPSFEVDSIILSPSASRLALVGMKGIAVMELPKQGEKYENSEKIFCK